MVTTEKVAAKKAATKKQPTKCKCRVDGCDKLTMGTFAPGHDAKLIRKLSDQVVAGKSDAAAAVKALRDRGGSDTLVEKLTKVIESKQAKKKVSLQGKGPKSPA